MPDFAYPDTFPIIASPDDTTGGVQFAVGRVIGGAQSSDGFDEATGLVDACVWPWARGARQCVAELSTFGASSPNVVIYDTTNSAAFEEAGATPFRMAEGRDAYTVSVDAEEGDVRLEFFSAGGALIQTATSPNVTTRDVVTFPINTGGIIPAEIFLVVSLRANVGQTARLYGVRVYEDATTL